MLIVMRGVVTLCVTRIEDKEKNNAIKQIAEKMFCFF